jgi:hypothetical protein
VDVPEAARLACVAVHGDGGGDDLATRGELLRQAVVVDIPRELADEDGFDLLFAALSSSGCGVAIGELDFFGGSGVAVGGFSFACEWVMSVE